MIAPQTDVYLLKVPLEIDDLNQLTFATKNSQYNYFASLPKKTYDAFKYSRKDGILRIPEIIDDLMGYNYVMYRNDGYNDKWFYAFIEDMEYANDEVTMVKIKTDVWQTWQFDLVYKPTFVQREHTNDDTIGSNTQPETVEEGEPVINGDVLHMGPNLTGNFITFMVSDVHTLSFINNEPASSYNGIFSGYTIFGVETVEQAKYVINEFISDNRADAIKNIYLAPKTLYANFTEHQPASWGFKIKLPQQLTTPVSITASQTIPRLPTLDGYIPKNNKLYTWPFSYLFVTNNVGGNAEYRYEDFTNATPVFSMSGILSSGCDIKLNPLKFKNIATPNQAYGIKVSKLPICSWNTDSYAIWLAQNQLNMRVSLTRNTLKTIAGVGTKNLEMAASGIGSYGGDLLNSLSEKYLAQHVPNEVHGDYNSADYNFSADLFIDIRRMSVRAEYARIIDDYFSVTGYATNRVKIPNITGRRNWNYVKTVGCYIEADIPQKDLQEIKSMFDKGITLWHNPATFADYSQNNDII